MQKKIIESIFELINIVLRNERPIQCTIVTPYLDTTICHTNMEVDSIHHLWPTTIHVTDMLPDMALVLTLMLIVAIKP